MGVGAYIKLNLSFKLSYLNSNFTLTLGYLNPALNNLALHSKSTSQTQYCGTSLQGTP